MRVLPAATGAVECAHCQAEGETSVMRNPAYPAQDAQTVALMEIASAIFEHSKATLELAQAIREHAYLTSPDDEEDDDNTRAVYMDGTPVQ